MLSDKAFGSDMQKRRFLKPKLILFLKKHFILRRDFYLVRWKDDVYTYIIFRLNFIRNFSKIRKLLILTIYVFIYSKFIYSECS